MADPIPPAAPAPGPPADVALVGRVVGAVPGWLWWRWRQSPILITTAAGVIIAGTSWFVETVPPMLGIADEDLPFTTQAQHAEALCMIETVQHGTCLLLVAVGQRAAEDCGDPPPCPPPAP